LKTIPLTKINLKLYLKVHAYPKNNSNPYLEVPSNWEKTCPRLLELKKLANIS
jgi:hypothetical protein